MKMIFLGILLTPFFAFADGTMSVRCTSSSVSSCEQKVFAELQKQSCGVNAQSVRCASQSGDAIYCTADVQNCSDASSDGFTGVNCHEGTLTKFSDRELTADWARSFLWIWVRSFCKQ